MKTTPLMGPFGKCLFWCNFKLGLHSVLYTSYCSAHLLRLLGCIKYFEFPKVKKCKAGGSIIHYSYLCDGSHATQIDPVLPDSHLVTLVGFPFIR